MYSWYPLVPTGTHWILFSGKIMQLFVIDVLLVPTGTHWILFSGKIMPMPVCTWTLFLKIEIINKDMKLIIYSPGIWVIHIWRTIYRRLSQCITNKSLFVKISPDPPPALTDCNPAASTSSLCRHALHGGWGVDFRSLQRLPAWIHSRILPP